MVLHAARLHIWPMYKWKAVYQNILCRSIVSSPDPTLSRVNNLHFSMRICFFIILLASVELKSRLLTWHYLFSMVTRPFSSEESRIWVWGYMLHRLHGVAWRELVNNRCHFWMVRQGTAWFHYVAIICHVGNPSKLLAGPITEVLGFFFGWPLQTLSSLLWCLHTLVLKHRTASAT